MNRIQWTWLSFVISLCSALHAAEAGTQANGRLRKVIDPANALCVTALSENETQRLHALFEALASDDFDERQRARDGILQAGPAASLMARSYENHEDAEVRSFARNFSRELILNYHGYLPVTPELSAALAAPRRMFIGKQEHFRSALERFLRDSELTAAFAWKNCPERIIGTHETIEIAASTETCLQTLLKYVGMSAVPRGGGIAGVTPDQVLAIDTQEHDFPTATLTAAQQDRLVKLLAAWLPFGQKFSVRENGIRARGSESELRLIARAIFFLAPDALKMPPFEALSGSFPESPEPSAVSELFDVLEAPVGELSMSGIEPLRGAARLRAAGHALEIDDSAPELVPAQPPVSLELRGLPLGLTLRWLALRANQPENAQGTQTVRLEVVPTLRERREKANASVNKPARIVVRLAAMDKPVSRAESAGYSDVSFMYAVGAANQSTEAADTAVCETIRAAFEKEAALFPIDESDFALFVFERRMISRGPPALLARLNEFLRTWRDTRKPPLVKWRVELDERLQREVDWNGSGLTAKTVLARLREVTGVNILLDRASSQTPRFEVDSHDVELLPPGRYSANALLLRLGEVSKALLTPRWGVIVLTPVNEIPEPKTQLKF